MAGVKENREEEEGNKDLVRQEDARTLRIIFINLDVSQVYSDEVPEELERISQNHRNNASDWSELQLLLNHFALVVFEFDLAQDPWT